MLTLTLTRLWQMPNSIGGRLCIAGIEQCYTLERPLAFEGQQNVPDETCVPTGTFGIEIRFSPRHQCEKPQLVGVPDRSDIQIDVANRVNQLLGCIAVGLGMPENDFIEGSQLAYNSLYPLIEAAVRNGGCEITIEDSWAQDLDARADDLNANEEKENEG